MATRSIPNLVLSTLNHLVGQEKWAQDLLSKHVGKSVLLILPLGEFGLLIRPGGFSNLIDGEMKPQVTLEIAQEAIFEALSGGKSAAAKHIRISGDVDLAHDLSNLASNLRWEAEEDLSKWVGDAAAHRIVLESKKTVEASKRAFTDLQGGIRDYLVHEKRAIIEIKEFETFKKELRVLRDDVERAEKRIERLMKELNRNMDNSGA